MHAPGPEREAARGRRRRRRNPPRTFGWLGWLTAAACTGFALAVFGVTLLAWRPLDERRLPETAPMILVLGAGMAADGTLGLNTIRRFEDALALVAEGRSNRIHFSGGDRLAGVTEGSLMAAIARERFPEAVITYEDSSQSTLQNAWFSMQVLGRVPPGTLLVTDALHLFRAWASFQWAGARGLVPVPSLPLDEIPAADRTRRILTEAIAFGVNAARAAVFSLRRRLGAEPEAILPILAGGAGAG